MAREDIPAEVIDPAAMIDYQPGSVVSRQIIKGEKGSVTIFAFAEGEGLSEHTAPFEALVHVIDGQATVTIGGTPHLVRAGQLIKLPANISHGLQAEQRFKMVLTMIRA